MWQFITFIIIFLIVIVWPLYAWWKETGNNMKLGERWRKEAEKKNK
jgi:hypothetical protein